MLRLTPFPHGTSDCPAELTQPLRFTASFPWSPRYSATKKPYNVRLILLYQRPFVNKFPRSQTQQKPLFRVAFLLRSALVIPAEGVRSAVLLKHSKRCACFANMHSHDTHYELLFARLFNAHSKHY